MPSGWNFGGPRLRVALYWLAVACVWAAIFVVGLVFVFSRDLPDTSKLYSIHKQPSITYLDRSGAVLGVRGSQYAPPADIDKLPAYVPGAFIAIEDRQFYNHWGFNLWGIVRSLAWDVTHHGGPQRGGSTITQQLARTLFLTPDQNLKRKVQELKLAIWLEHNYTKKQILALYLNHVLFWGRRLRHRVGGATLLQQACFTIDSGRGGYARRSAEVPHPL